MLLGTVKTVFFFVVLSDRDMSLYSLLHGLLAIDIVVGASVVIVSVVRNVVVVAWDDVVVAGDVVFAGDVVIA